MSEEEKKQQVREIVKKLRTAINDNEEKILTEFDNHENNIYGAIIKKFYIQLLSFEECIRSLLSDGELYTAKIIYRATIEHSITLQYIWCREHILKDDNLTSEKYFIIYRVAENIKRFGFDNKVNRILDENLEKDTVKAYANHRGEKEIVARKSLEHSSQFKLEKMVEFLIKDESLDFVLGGFNRIYLDTVSDYNVLSSNVHGGPSAMFWDAEKNIYTAERISTDLDILIGMMMKLVIWAYTNSSGDDSVEKASK
jgi:hypothetical protein